MDRETIKFIVTIVSAIIALLSFLGLGTLFAMFWKDLHDKKKKERDENSELREAKRLNDMKNLIQTELLSPIQTQLTNIGSDIKLVKKGVQATCRNDLEDMYAKAEKDGFCSNEDKQKFESTYQVYHALGNNGVMDAKRERLLALPESKPTARRAAPKKKVLVESK